VTRGEAHQARAAQLSDAVVVGRGELIVLGNLLLQRKGVPPHGGPQRLGSAFFHFHFCFHFFQLTSFMRSAVTAAVVSRNGLHLVVAVHRVQVVQFIHSLHTEGGASVARGWRLGREGFVLAERIGGLHPRHRHALLGACLLTVLDGIGGGAGQGALPQRRTRTGFRGRDAPANAGGARRERQSGRSPTTGQPAVRTVVHRTAHHMSPRSCFSSVSEERKKERERERKGTC
jgi:hypothetical protein